MTHDFAQVPTTRARNWRTICPRREPNVFRSPTSLALPAERAVERFMKLMQAMSMMKIPIPPKKYTYMMFPAGSSPSRVFARR